MERWHTNLILIIKIGQNTKMGPGHLRKLTVSQTPVKNHQLKLSMSKIMIK